MPYEDEIPKELKEGEIYSSKVIKYLVNFNDDIVVLCNSKIVLNEFTDNKYEVIKKFSSYLISSDKIFRIPAKQNTIYLIEEV